MYTRYKVRHIIAKLREYDALMQVSWEPDMRFPKIWLKSWCRMPDSVTVGTAESVLNLIQKGRLRPPVNSIPIRPAVLIETTFGG